MPKGLEVIAGQATAPGATLTALTMNAGNSSTVRMAPLNANVALLSFWGRNNAAGIFRIRSPRLHDNVQGIRVRIPATDPTYLQPMQPWQRLIPQDTLTLEISGSATGGQLEQAALLIYYTDLPGVSARLIGTDELMKRAMNLWTTEIAITPGAAGGYSGQVAINSTFDNFKANTDYALLGYEVDAPCTVVRFTSPDFGQLGLGGPGMMSNVAGGFGGRHITAEWFVRLTRYFGIPLIPTFNAANKFGTLVDVMQNQGATAVNVTAVLMELAAPGSQGYSSGLSG
jgi:hypothetical protein